MLLHILRGLLPGRRVLRLGEDLEVGERSVLRGGLAHEAVLVAVHAVVYVAAAERLDLVVVGRALAVATLRARG